MAFGDQAGAVRRLNLADHGAFHRAQLAGEAVWEVDGHIRELPQNEQNRRPRWRIKLKGAVQINSGFDLSPSYEEPGVSMAITVRSPNLDGGPRLTDVLRIVLCELLPIPCDGGLSSYKQAEQRARYWQDQPQTS
jgi:hypothetical protein